MRPTYPLLLVALTLGLGACSGTHESQPDRAVPLAARPPARDLSGLDVPSLLNLSIDELSRRVGPPQPVPSDFSDPVLVAQMQRNQRLDSTALFHARGLAMVASYNHQSRQLSDLLLLGENENELMRRAQLQLSADNYLVLPVFQARRPTQLVGLRVLATTLNQ